MLKLVFVGVFFASSAFADPLVDAVKKFEEFTDDMCKCGAGDVACAQRVVDSQKKYADELAKTADRNARPIPDLAKKMEPIMARYTKCATKAMMPKDTSTASTLTMADYVKQLGGNWKCKGKMSGKDATATLATTRGGTLGDSWIQTTTSSTQGKSTIKGLEYTRLDDNSKTWVRSGVDTAGNVLWATSPGPVDGKMVWEGDVRAGTTPVKYRGTDDFSKPKELVSISEVSLDGKSWATVVEVTCKR